MKDNLNARRLIERALLILIPFAILGVFWFSTKGAPERFHLITFTSYGIVTLVAITLSLVDGRFLRPSVAIHVLWFTIYLTTAVFQKIHLETASSYAGDSRLSGLLWITFYLVYALFAPIIATVVWIVTNMRHRQSEYRKT
jgi:intracellular septation protein A